MKAKVMGKRCNVIDRLSFSRRSESQFTESSANYFLRSTWSIKIAIIKRITFTLSVRLFQHCNISFTWLITEEDIDLSAADAVSIGKASRGAFGNVRCYFIYSFSLLTTRTFYHCIRLAVFVFFLKVQWWGAQSYASLSLLFNSKFNSNSNGADTAYICKPSACLHTQKYADNVSTEITLVSQE